jgi:hypothetical protein
VSRERIEQYRRFVEQCPAREDGYLFAEPRARFRPEPGDELLALRPMPVSGIEARVVKAAFDALCSGPQSYARLLVLLGPNLESFLEQTFAKVVLAPKAVAALEIELPCAEIVRFPGSPYEVVRSYWRNMIAVRGRLQETPTPPSAAEMRSLLLELHQLALLGESAAGSRSSFYLPASALGRKRPEPGSFYEVPSSFERRGDDVVLTSGARVSVPLLGGEHYWQLLAESVSDPEAVGREERQTMLDELDLGRVVHARAENESVSRPWFLPPRPLLDEHFSALAVELERAAVAEAQHDVPAALEALAAFQYRFVRTHPLPSANQSISMCFVNAALRRLLGVGIPHLLLDQMALRFSLSAYQQLFARAARAWSAPWPNPAERQRQLLRMRQDLDAFVSELSQVGSLLEARALLADRPEAARLALLGARD